MDVATPDPLHQLALALSAGPAVVLTGAGLSTASGIPAYRDQHGQWQAATPIRHQEFIASASVRQRYWARSYVGWPTMGRAVPNVGHEALAMLARQGAVSTVITQNVDGLHQQAGHDQVIELHGSIGQVRCLSCNAGYARARVQAWLTAINPDFKAPPSDIRRSAPDGDAHVEANCYANFVVPACPACDGVLKPDVVFFGDNVPRDRVTNAMQALEAAAVLLVVGSSLTVYSGYRFAERAHQTGKPIFAINRGTTRADSLLTAKIDADCGHALTQLLGLLKRHDALALMT